jgi:hypothetical protein
MRSLVPVVSVPSSLIKDADATFPDVDILLGENIPKTSKVVICES